MAEGYQTRPFEIKSMTVDDTTDTAGNITLNLSANTNIIIGAVPVRNSSAYATFYSLLVNSVSADNRYVIRAVDVQSPLVTLANTHIIAKVYYITI